MSLAPSPPARPSAPRPSMRDSVGPVLEAGEVAEAIIETLKRSHPSLELIDRGAYLRVLVPGRCVMSRTAVEQALGRPFVLPADLEAVMPSFKGRFSVNAGEAVWEAVSTSKEPS